MSTGEDDRQARANGSSDQREPQRLTLNAAVQRRRTDQDFFLRLREVMQQNHRALERLGR